MFIRKWAPVVFVPLLALGAPVIAQAQGAVTGMLLEGGAVRPMAGVQMVIVGSTLSAVPSSINALDMLIAEYEARVWGTEQLNSEVNSVNTSLTTEVGPAREALDDLFASFEQSVWRVNAIAGMPEIHVPATTTVASVLSDVLNALVADFEAKVWEPVLAANSEVCVDVPVALNLVTED